MTPSPKTVPDGQDELYRAITISDVLASGEMAMREDRGPAFTKRQLVWRLLQEAAETEKAIRVGRQVNMFPKGTIEHYHSTAEIRQTENQWAADGISYPPRIMRRATEVEIRRHSVVVEWLRFVRSHQPSARRKMLFAMAGGMTAERVADTGLFAVPTAKAAEAAKIRALNQIIDGIERLGAKVPEGDLRELGVGK